ncbi:MAG: DUF4194 domain-containing protein [Lachnospiraceae bacterium]|jgi:hypothetical protein|nr:DUF4194 domain-containing protein [Lachnospiraceae bacterium]MCI9333800.1 DUF4194 domain-containing protein [Lachnospiraceae bacterium]
MDFLEGMLQKDKDEFVRICNRLLGSCFVCKRNETSRRDYYFITQHREKFSQYLSVLGYRLEINEEYGVVQLTNPQNYNRYNMKLFESVILLILRILYDEKKRELSVSDEVIINMGDIHEKFLTLKIRDKMMDKTTLRNAISTMRRFQLVEVLDKELSNQDSRLIIYDSILMAVRVEDIRQAYEKLENYKKGGKINEETDESEAD